jgi:hypothetical protein
MKKHPSKKHHYLPRYYLRGFTNSGDGFFVYDKQGDKIFETSPDGAFFENNLNTVTFKKGDSSDFLEDLYAHIESQSWESLDNIRKSTSKSPIERLDKQNLFFFLLVLHWRLPGNRDFVEKLSEKAFLGNNEIDYFTLNSKSGKEVPRETIEAIKNSDGFKKSLKLLLPFAPFLKDKDWGAELGNWRFLYTGDGASSYIVGDNPIVTKGDYDHDPVNCLKEFVFPVSGRILLVNTDRPISSGTPPEFVIRFNIAIIERAQRFAACQDKKFLESLVKMYVQFGKTGTIINGMFDILENIKVGELPI